MLMLKDLPVAPTGNSGFYLVTILSEQQLSSGDLIYVLTCRMTVVGTSATSNSFWQNGVLQHTMKQIVQEFYLKKAVALDANFFDCPNLWLTVHLLFHMFPQNCYCED